MVSIRGGIAKSFHSVPGKGDSHVFDRRRLCSFADVSVKNETVPFSGSRQIYHRYLYIRRSPNRVNRPPARFYEPPLNEISFFFCKDVAIWRRLPLPPRARLLEEAPG